MWQRCLKCGTDYNDKKSPSCPICYDKYKKMEDEEAERLEREMIRNSLLEELRKEAEDG
jgi:predicted  nucleic acid-binding Zn-ribbon protein